MAVIGLFAIAVAPQAQTVDQTGVLLGELIRANTSNPPGNGRRIAELLAPRFRALGFEVKIVPTPDSTKAHLIARLRGDGSKKPVLLAAHADVVRVERETWTEHTLHPSPFTLLLLHSHTARGILPMGIT